VSACFCFVLLLPDPKEANRPMTACEALHAAADSGFVKLAATSALLGSASSAMQHGYVCRSSMTEVCSCQDITLSVAAPTVARMPISAAPSRSPACRTVWPTWTSDPTALMSSPALDAACIMSQCCCTCQAQAQQGMADDDKGQLGLVQGLPYCYSAAVQITGRQKFSCFSFQG